MIIANPIYDVVFKYLLEDTDIARGLFSTIIGEEVIDLTVQPQEVTVHKVQATEIIRILRLDFKATIRTKTGETKMILVELQKARKLFDIMRFRTYLGENYKKGEDVVNDKGETETNPLPIITIYFLGFKLEYITIAAIKVDRTYRDADTGESLSPDIKEPFIENLTHDSYVIQIPFLGDVVKTQMQKVLRVFNQKFKKKEDRHRLDFSENTDSPLVQKMLDRLNRAIASEEILAEMNLEDEVEKAFGKVERELELVRKEAAKNKEEAEKNKEEAEKNKKEAEKNKEEAAEKGKQLEEKGKQLEEKDRELEILRQELEAFKKSIPRS